VSARNILPEHDLFDAWLLYPNSAGLRAIISRVKLIYEIRQGKFDALFYLVTRNRTAKQIERDELFFKLCGINRIFGADHLKNHQLSTEIPIPTPIVESEADFLMESLREDGVPGAEGQFDPDLGLTYLEQAAADGWLARNEANASGSLILAVAPGSKWESKVWEESRFAEVVTRLIKSNKVFPVIFGGPEDREKGGRLLAEWGCGANAAGELDVRTAAAALKKCSLYLGNDTGTMHLAAAVGTPCVAIFAAIDWIGRWHPFGSRNHIFRKSVECEGCHSPLCFNKRKCLDLISSDEVYDACVLSLADDGVDATTSVL